MRQMGWPVRASGQINKNFKIMFRNEMIRKLKKLDIIRPPCKKTEIRVYEKLAIKVFYHKKPSFFTIKHNVSGYCA